MKRPPFGRGPSNRQRMHRKSTRKREENEKRMPQRMQNQGKMLQFSGKRPWRPRAQKYASHAGFTATFKKTRSHARRGAQKKIASGPHGSHIFAENDLKPDCGCEFHGRGQKSLQDPSISRHSLENTTILEENAHSAPQGQKHYRSRPKTTKMQRRPQKSRKNTRIVQKTTHSPPK